MATKNDDVEEIILTEESQLQIQPSFFLIKTGKTD